MKPDWMFIGGCLLAAVAPLVERGGPPPSTAPEAAALPDDRPFHFRHHRLEPVALDPEVREAFRHFPGGIATYQSDDARWIVRRVTRPTRQLHPATHCFRAGGFETGEPTLLLDPYEEKWATFTATRNRQTWRIHEQIREENGTQIWTDTSAWYWDALRSQGGKGNGPWLAITRIEEIPPHVPGS